MTHPFYQQRAPRIAEQLNANLALVADEFARTAPQVDLEQIAPALANELADVIAALPWVGGDKGRMTAYFEQNAGIIALGRVLLAQGLERPVVAHLLTRTFLAPLTQLDEETRFAMGRKFMANASIKRLHELAEKSLERENPGDFVYTMVDAGSDDTGHAFDFGIDYHECGFCKMCARTGDDAILPMICNMDEESYALRGIRLTRTQTLASGASHCNFRYSLLPEAKKDSGESDN